MEESPSRRQRVLELVKVAAVLACWIAGVVLRFQPSPADIVGGGLLVIGTFLLLYWARRRPPRRLS